MQVTHTDEYDQDSAAWEASVSSWMDGESELRAEELDTPYGRQLWDNYHLIGDVLRSQDLAIQPSEMFYARVSRAIDDEPTILAPRSLALSRRRLVWPVGMAVAALAVLAVVALPYIASPGDSMLVPATQVAIVESGDDSRLYEYFDAHQGLAGVVPALQVSYDNRVSD